MIVIKQLSHDNWSSASLDGFVRHQVVTEAWRCVDGTWQLLPISFTEDWPPEQLRAIAADVAAHIGVDQVGFGAFEDGRTVGFITVGTQLFGQTARYAELVCFQVSQEHRGLGIGRQLFGQACVAARAIGAEKLYISSHSSRESQAAYARLGCVHALEINEARAAEEPFDVQLEYVLQPSSLCFYKQRLACIAMALGYWAAIRRIQPAYAQHWIAG